MEDVKQVTSGCSLPPKLDELALLAAADDEATPETVEHLRHCHYCAARAREFAELQGQLRKRLYRAFCPTSDELVAFYSGIVGARQHVTITAHLAICTHCARELKLLGDMASKPLVVQNGQTSPLRRVVAEITAPRPCFSIAFRNNETPRAAARQYAYSAERVRLTVNVKDIADRAGRVIVWGSLLCEDKASEGSSNVTASLLRNECIISSSIVDRSGNFVLDNLSPGNYSLSLRLPDCEVVVESLHL